MKKELKRTSIFILIFLLFLGSKISAQPTFNELSSIKIQNFNKQIYSENFSCFEISSESQNFKLNNNINQKIIKQKYVKPLTIVKIQTGLFSASQPAKKQYLENTFLLNLNSKEIKKLSRKIKRNDQLLLNIENIVDQQITQKMYGIPLISAQDIVNLRKGDCTEHAVLAVALLRKLNIPARAIVGVFLSKNFLNQKNCFVYHMWVEAWFNNKWQIVDATRPGKKHYNRYLAFSEHSLKSLAPISYLQKIAGQKNLAIKYCSNNQKK